MKKLTCEIGDKFGDWTVVGQTISKNGHTYAAVQCKCGKITELCLSDLIHGRAHSCKSCAAKKRGHIGEISIGDKIKKWTVVDGPRTYHNVVQFKVRCECGTQRWIQPNELLNPNKCFSCIKCSKSKLEGLRITQFNKLKRSAAIRNIPFNVSIEYLQRLWEIQDHKCAITGDIISSIRDASLDRINSSEGYFENNVQWVTTRANISKHTMTMNELYEFCKKVLNHANQQPSKSLTTLEGSETNG